MFGQPKEHDHQIALTMTNDMLFFIIYLQKLGR